MSSKEIRQFLLSEILEKYVFSDRFSDRNQIEKFGIERPLLRLQILKSALAEQNTRAFDAELYSLGGLTTLLSKLSADKRAVAWKKLFQYYPESWASHVMDFNPDTSTRKNKDSCYQTLEYCVLVYFTHLSQPHSEIRRSSFSLSIKDYWPDISLLTSDEQSVRTQKRNSMALNWFNSLVVEIAKFETSHCTPIPLYGYESLKNSFDKYTVISFGGLDYHAPSANVWQSYIDPLISKYEEETFRIAIRNSELSAGSRTKLSARSL